MRVLAYNNTDVFIVCFSITQPESLWEVQDIWIPELQEFADEGVPILLVGMQHTNLCTLTPLSYHSNQDRFARRFRFRREAGEEW